MLMQMKMVYVYSYNHRPAAQFYANALTVRHPEEWELFVLAIPD